MDLESLDLPMEAPVACPAGGEGLGDLGESSPSKAFDDPGCSTCIPGIAAMFRGGMPPLSWRLALIFPGRDSVPLGGLTPVVKTSGVTPSGEETGAGEVTDQDDCSLGCRTAIRGGDERLLMASAGLMTRGARSRPGLVTAVSPC